MNRKTLIVSAAFAALAGCGEKKTEGAANPAATAMTPADETKADVFVAKAEDVDRTYLDDQIDAHQKMLNLLQHYAQADDNKALQDFAAATAPAVQKHLDRAKAIKDGLK